MRNPGYAPDPAREDAAAFVCAEVPGRARELRAEAARAAGQFAVLGWRRLIFLVVVSASFSRRTVTLVMRW